MQNSDYQMEQINKKIKIKYLILYQLLLTVQKHVQPYSQKCGLKNKKKMHNEINKNKIKINWNWSKLLDSLQGTTRWNWVGFPKHTNHILMIQQCLIIIKKCNHFLLLLVYLTKKQKRTYLTFFFLGTFESQVSRLSLLSGGVTSYKSGRANIWAWWSSANCFTASLSSSICISSSWGCVLISPYKHTTKLIQGFVNSSLTCLMKKGHKQNFDFIWKLALGVDKSQGNFGI